ncbi:2810_t:CDS:2 [Ambispora gerdemannii]|uniref:2810_t:CDS:1 n=1 Tax=Ambispora gerdemannii TaxID=144530 RepID=A0A9N9D3L3_9GLOM|nr:2810_t:CDS:2 [Ambispora gerdemannii]
MEKIWEEVESHIESISKNTRATQFNKEFCIDIEKNVRVTYQTISPLKTRYEPTGENDLMFKGLSTYVKVLSTLEKVVQWAANPSSNASLILLLQRLNLIDPKTLLTNLQNAVVAIVKILAHSRGSLPDESSHISFPQPKNPILFTPAQLVQNAEVGPDPPKSIFEKTISWLNSAIRDEHIKQFDYAEFTEFMNIGQGGFGEVKRAYWDGTNQVYALKSIKPQEETSKEERNLLVREIKMLYTLRHHDNVVRFHGISYNEAERTHYLVMQYANGGTLRSYLHTNFKYLTWQDKRRIAEEIANGLFCIHKENINHRDLHSKNVLVHDGRMMIADFGLAKLLDSQDVSKTAAGMVAYIEPQLYKQLHYKRDKQSDIYSFGILLWEISSGRIPNIRPAEVVHGYRELPIAGTPKDYFELYTQCWDDKPNKRPSIEHIIKGKRLEDMRFEPVLSKEEIDEMSAKRVNYDSDSNNSNSTEPKVDISENDIYLLP